MSDVVVHYEVDRAIAVVTLDSPSNRNALSVALVTQLTAHLATAAADESVRAVVLTHAGSVFCAGADLKEQAAEGGLEQGTTRMLELLRTILGLPKPVVARIDGAVRAGGIGVVGACDIALAGTQTTFAFTEVRLGVTPAIISLTTLGRMRERAAARYFLTGEKFGAAQAHAAGLITDACADLDAELDIVLDGLRACSPQGLAATKPLTTRDALARFEAGATQMQRLSADLFASDEAREGITAFLQKRPPSWAVPAAGAQ